MEDQHLTILNSYRENGDPGLRGTLIESHMPIVRGIAARLQKGLPRLVDVDDLVSAGVLGLMAAIEGFDASHGASFRSYCALRIRGAILDDLRKQDWLPRSARQRIRQIEATTQSLLNRLGRQPSDLELSEATGMSVSELQESFEAAESRFVSMSQQTTPQESDEPLRMLRDDRSIDPARAVDQKELLALVLDSLSARERMILVMSNEGQSMRKIGETLGLTPSRVCQIQNNVKSRLRAKWRAARA